MNTISTSRGRYEYKKIIFEIGSTIINKKKSTENLLLFKEIMDRNHINFLLAYGTLLGAVREKDFIDHDEDTDVIILDEQREDFINLLFEFRLNYFEVGRYEDDLLSLVRNGEYIDIYIFRKAPKGKRKMGKYITEERFLLDTISYPFLEKNFLIPKEYISYLEYYYGKKWKIPKKNFHANGGGLYNNFKRFIKNNFKFLVYLIFIFRKFIEKIHRNP